MKDPRVHLHEIGLFAREIEMFSDALDFAAFEHDTKTVRAVCYCFLAVGEAVFRLERDFPGFLLTEVSAEIPWQKIVGTRNFLAHGYDRVDVSTLWQLIRVDLKPLIEAADCALTRLGDAE